MSPPALDPDAARVLAEADALDAPPLSESTVAEARAAAHKGRRYMPPADPSVLVGRESIPGPHGPLELRTFTPPDDPDGVAVYLHGGGWVVGDTELLAPACSLLSAKARIVVVSVEYRRAPEHRYPVALEESVAAAEWAAGHPAAGGAGPALVGDSAGGGLTAGAALRVRDRGLLAPALQVLVNPALDPSMSLPAFREFGEGYGLTRESMDFYWRAWLGERLGEPPDDVAVLRADARGVAPALVLVSECDPLRDEGEAYAARLRSAGVAVTLERFARLPHDLFWMGGAVPAAAASIDVAAAALRGAVDAAAAS